MVAHDARDNILSEPTSVVSAPPCGTVTPSKSGLSERDRYPDAGEEADQHGAGEEVGEQTQARDPSQEK